MILSHFSGIMTCENDYLQIFYADQSEKICGSSLASIGRIKIPATKFTVKFHTSNIPVEGSGFVFTFVTKKYIEDNVLSNKTGNNIGCFKLRLYIP